ERRGRRGGPRGQHERPAPRGGGLPAGAAGPLSRRLQRDRAGRPPEGRRLRLPHPVTGAPGAAHDLAAPGRHAGPRAGADGPGGRHRRAPPPPRRPPPRRPPARAGPPAPPPGGDPGPPRPAPPPRPPPPPPPAPSRARPRPP